jgi:hypothetical protein
MGPDSSSQLIAVLELPVIQIQYLYKLRVLDHLVAVKYDEYIYVAGFTETERTEAYNIPFANHYLNKNGELRKPGHHVPTKTLPGHLNWLPLCEMLPLSLPFCDGHGFTDVARIPLQLIPDEVEKEPVAIMTGLSDLLAYAEQASSVRLESLRWTLLADMNKAFIVGQPLVPLPGITFWRQESIFIPTGYSLNFPVAIPQLLQQINLKNDEWMIWLSVSEYIRINRKAVSAFSRGSLRLTLAI